VQVVEPDYISGAISSASETENPPFWRVFSFWLALGIFWLKCESTVAVDQPTNCAPQYGEIVPSKPTAIANNKKTINESPSLPMSVSC
ncbi:hypothetical protein, partial [Pseudomonas syringae group genomosp. 3]|uniref:hypothetical protein n=1 Tax=Pseudomonas syringae group genomosp. 3 TaxID=251701 RepID=UPI001E31D6F4